MKKLFYFQLTRKLLLASSSLESIQILIPLLVAQQLHTGSILKYIKSYYLSILHNVVFFYNKHSFSQQIINKCSLIEISVFNEFGLQRYTKLSKYFFFHPNEEGLGSYPHFC